ncbi:MAG: hypothetical protein A2V76_02480 [Candidatus Aminicenantes bacterium RBG_16_63_14]|nr:MAG: hypothetical protein A2V76_02480 [Candidatus Aminicenantes bacterium RBG_16_63_14]
MRQIHTAPGVRAELADVRQPRLKQVRIFRVNDVFFLKNEFGRLIGNSIGLHMIQDDLDAVLDDLIDLRLPAYA